MRADVSGWTSVGRYNLRIQTLILYGGAITFVVSAAWSAFYASAGSWLHAAYALLSALSGGVMLLLAWRSHLRAAAIVMSHAILLTTLIGCFFDAPPDGLSRSVHFHLFPIVAATFLVFSHEGFYLRVLLPVFGVLSFLVSPWVWRRCLEGTCQSGRRFDRRCLVAYHHRRFGSVYCGGCPADQRECPPYDGRGDPKGNRRGNSISCISLR
ncbi:hypothetical protein V6L77_14930 [Pannonibacter sp. Pt2-lr]